MANTSYLRYTVEPWVRGQLADRFGQRFTSKVLQLAPGGYHEFDAVSENEDIVASIKANSGMTSGGKHPTGKVATCLNEVYFLSLIEAPTRVLVLTNPDFYEIFTRTTFGQIATGIKIELIALPSEMQRDVDRITRRASEEMGQGVIAAAVANEIEEAGERGEDVSGTEV